MANKSNSTWLTDEVADFLARSPSREEMLAYRPSDIAQERYKSLLAKSNKGLLSADEEWELNQFEHLEILMQSVKARLRTRRAVPS
jgi:hypothetical protein